MKSPKPLPEFKVTLTRVKQGQSAYPPRLRDSYMGRRTKLGGKPDWEQQPETPKCSCCDRLMTFVAQIDSVEHESKQNPHSISAVSKDQKWMLGDVGMIYVFFCMECLESKSVFQSG